MCGCSVVIKNYYHFPFHILYYNITIMIRNVYISSYSLIFFFFEMVKAELHISISVNSFDDLLHGGWDLSFQSNGNLHNKRDLRYPLDDLLRNLCSINILHTLVFLNDFPILRKLVPVTKSNYAYQLCFTVHNSILYIYMNYNSSSINFLFFSPIFSILINLLLQVFNMRGNIYGNCLMEEFFQSFLGNFSEYCPFYFIKGYTPPPYYIFKYCPTFLYDLSNLNLQKNHVSFFNYYFLFQILILYCFLCFRIITNR